MQNARDRQSNPTYFAYCAQMCYCATNTNYLEICVNEKKESGYKLARYICAADLKQIFKIMYASSTRRITQVIRK